jgi:hypothetical protein
MTNRYLRSLIGACLVVAFFTAGQGPVCAMTGGCPMMANETDGGCGHGEAVNNNCCPGREVSQSVFFEQGRLATVKLSAAQVVAGVRPERSVDAPSPVWDSEPSAASRSVALYTLHHSLLI